LREKEGVGRERERKGERKGERDRERERLVVSPSHCNTLQHTAIRYSTLQRNARDIRGTR